MDKSNTENIKILFAEHHQELLTSKDTSNHPISSLLKRLDDLNYLSDFTDTALTPDLLDNYQILVLGAPLEDLKGDEEIQAIQEFVEKKGGGLLILSNSEAMMKPLSRFTELTKQMGFQFREYHNYPPKSLLPSQPHYITANLRQRLQVERTAFFHLNNGAHPLAFVEVDEKNLVPAGLCKQFGRGRVVAVGDVGLFSDRLFEIESNASFIARTFQWLAFQNPIDIKEIQVPQKVKFGESGTVVLTLQNTHSDMRVDVECILVSDAAATISEPVCQKNYALPPGKIVQMQWSVSPKKLGKQELRLIVHTERESSLFFDRLPDMLCVAPGYLTLEIRDANGDLKTTCHETERELKTTFETGDKFTVEGAFHWSSISQEHPSVELDLGLAEGLVEYQDMRRESEKSTWFLKSLETGKHHVTLRVRETGQQLPALISVSSSREDRLAEISAAYVEPLDAEIAARLKQVDERFGWPEIRDLPFNIVSPEEYVNYVYDKESASWLRDVITAARREQWYNIDLLKLILTYIAPTYYPEKGSFLPYDPELASHLGEIHSGHKKHLEYNLLCSRESEEITIKQNVAAFLVHEKYGHGFFYTQTRLGQELIRLRKLNIQIKQHEQYRSYQDDYQEVMWLIEDSGLIVNEGFAAWLELTFLKKLDREVRQAAYPCYIRLIRDGASSGSSQFFKHFPPLFDSRYREGYERLELINRKYNIYCTLQAFMIATDIDFGLSKIVSHDLKIDLKKFEGWLGTTKTHLLGEDDVHFHSHVRLREIADMLYDYSKQQVATTHIRKQYCRPEPGGQSSIEPLQTLITKQLKWEKIL